MWFIISFGALLYGSIMAWLSGNPAMVILAWIAWGIGFFAFPVLFESGWPFLALQSILALVLLLRWKLDTT